MKIGLTAPTVRPACARRLLREEEGESLTAAKQTLSLLLPVELLSGDGLSRIDVGSSGLVHGESPGLHHGCAAVGGRCAVCCRWVFLEPLLLLSPQTEHD